jgi:hypothetical protein
MRQSAFERAFAGVQIKRGEQLTPLHRRVMRSLERRAKFRQQRRTNKGR